MASADTVDGCCGLICSDIAQQAPALFAACVILIYVSKDAEHYARLVERARELIAQGATLEDAAASVGCSPSTLRRHGVYAARRSQQDPSATDVPSLSESLAAASSSTTLPISIQQMLDPRTAEEKARDLDRAKGLVDQARQFLSIQYPYYQQMLYMLNWVWDAPGVPTLAVDDKGRLFVNSQFVASEEVTGDDTDTENPVLKTMALLMHEVNHLLRYYYERKGSRQHKAWNYSHDIEINDDLDHIGALLPASALRSSQYGLPPRETGEFYYQKLKEQHEEKEKQKQKGQQGQQGQPQPGEGGEGGEPSDPFEEPPECPACKGENEGDGEESDGDGDGGSPGGQGQPGGGPEHNHDHNHGRCGREALEDMDPEDLDRASQDQDVEGMSKSRMDDLIRDTATDILKEAQKGRGNVPEGLVRAAKDILRPKANWRQLLRSRVASATQRANRGLRRKTYTRIDGRHGPVVPGKPKVLRPGIVQHAPTVAIVTDTSGSMSRDDLERALSECQGIIDQGLRGCKVDVIACDAAVGVMQRVKNAKDIVLTGGGGTDMGIGMLAAVEEADPDVLIVLTDGETGWPTQKPKRKLEVLIGIIHDPSADEAYIQSLADAVPKYATAIKIPTE